MSTTPNCPHCGAPMRYRLEAPTSPEWAAFVAAWRERYGDTPARIVDLHALALEYLPGLRTRVQLGQMLALGGATQTHKTRSAKKPAKWTPPKG